LKQIWKVIRFFRLHQEWLGEEKFFCSIRMVIVMSPCIIASEIIFQL